MKRDMLCGCIETVVYDDEHPETIAPHVICRECQEAAAANKRRLNLIAMLASHALDDRDLEQIDRLVDHLFGEKKDKALTMAGFYSLTPAKRKKIKRQMDEDFGPQRPDANQP